MDGGEMVGWLVGVCFHLPRGIRVALARDRCLQGRNHVAHSARRLRWRCRGPITVWGSRTRRKYLTQLRPRWPLIPRGYSYSKPITAGQGLDQFPSGLVVCDLISSGKNALGMVYAIKKRLQSCLHLSFPSVLFFHPKGRTLRAHRALGRPPERQPGPGPAATAQTS